MVRQNKNNKNKIEGRYFGNEPIRSAKCLSSSPLFKSNPLKEGSHFVSIPCIIIQSSRSQPFCFDSIN